MSEPFDPNSMPAYPGPPAAPQQPAGFGYQPSPYSPQIPYAPVPMPMPMPPTSMFDAAQRTRRRKIAIGVGVGVAVLVAAVLVVSLVITSSSSTPARIALPSSFDGYSKLDNATSHSVESRIRAGGNSANVLQGEMFNASSIGSYASDTGDVPSLVAVTLPTSRIPANAGRDHTAFVHAFLYGAIPQGQGVDLPGGAHGGALECGYATFGAAHETMCAWSDTKTSGVLVSVALQQSLTPRQLADVTDNFRDCVD